MSVHRCFAPGIIKATAAYEANPVNFDGSNDYLTRGADFTSNADSKLILGSFWIRPTAEGLSRVYFNSNGFGEINLDTSEQVAINFENSSGTRILEINSSTLSLNNWHHCMFASNQTTAHLYLDGVSDLNTTTLTDDTIDFTRSNHGVGATPVGGDKFAGDMADVQLWFGVYADLSSAANRAKFLSGSSPVDPSIATSEFGTQTLLLTGATATWHTNGGSGNGMTENGALTDGTGPVSL